MKHTQLVSSKIQQGAPISALIKPSPDFYIFKFILDITDLLIFF